MSRLAPGLSLLRVFGLCPPSSRTREVVYRTSVLVLTFLAYTAYHASRKPISIVKNSPEFLDCTQDKEFCHSWISEIDGKQEDDAKTMLGLLDTAYLVSYAVFMFARKTFKR